MANNVNTVASVTDGQKDRFTITKTTLCITSRGKNGKARQEPQGGTHAWPVTAAAAAYKV